MRHTLFFENSHVITCPKRVHASSHSFSGLADLVSSSCAGGSEKLGMDALGRQGIGKKVLSQAAMFMATATMNMER